MGSRRSAIEQELIRGANQLLNRVTGGAISIEPQSHGLYGEAHAAFRYVVEVDNQAQGAFTECKLPTIEWEFEVVKEGGLNNQVHNLPIRRKPARVMLKNGVGTKSLTSWFMNSLENHMNIRGHRKNITIKLIDGLDNVIQTWHIQDAFPAKWEGPQLKSDSTSIAIQTLEMVCGEVTVGT